jgi:hypothetical protein
MAPDVRKFASRLRAASEAPGGPRTSFYEAAGQIHSWPVLLLPGVEEHEAPMWAFYERALGLAGGAAADVTVVAAGGGGAGKGAAAGTGAAAKRR